MTPSAQSLSALAVRSHRVLVVDDEPLNLQVFDYNFGSEFSLLFAANAEEALRILEVEPVAVMVADHRMPGMLGIDLLAEVAKSRPEVVRVLLTAHADVPLLVQALNRGILFRYIAKPWAPDTMRQDMLRALEQHILLTDHQRLLRLAADQLHAADSIAAALLPELERAQAGLGVAQGALERGAVDEGRAALARVNEELRPFSRGVARAAARAVTTIQPVDLGAVVHGALWSVQRRADAAEVPVSVVVDPASPSVMGMAERLREAVAALLHNAIDAASFRPAPRSVWVRVGPQRGALEIRVSDSAGGFDADTRPVAFRSARNRPGLGLAVARTVAEAHGGTLDLTGAPEGRVSLLLPARGPIG